MSATMVDVMVRRTFKQKSLLLSVEDESDLAELVMRCKQRGIAGNANEALRESMRFMLRAMRRSDEKRSVEATVQKEVARQTAEVARASARGKPRKQRR